MTPKRFGLEGSGGESAVNFAFYYAFTLGGCALLLVLTWPGLACKLFTRFPRDNTNGEFADHGSGRDFCTSKVPVAKPI
jgi:hypothetical protein